MLPLLVKVPLLYNPSASVLASSIFEMVIIPLLITVPEFCTSKPSSPPAKSEIAKVTPSLIVKF